MDVPSEPRCPRCGYDLSGVVASWRDSCPLEGVCSECGLAFIWRDVCNPNYGSAPRLFEHATRRYVSSFLLTLGLVHTPWRLWRRLLMEHWVAPLRLALFSVLGFVAICGAGAPLVLALVTVIRFEAPRWWNWRRVLAAPTWEVGATRGWLAVGAMLAPFLLMPMSFVLVATSMRRASVRPAHLARITAYSLPVTAWLLIGSAISLHAATWIDLADIGIGGWSSWEVSEAVYAWGPFLAAAIAPLLLMAWWTLAVRRYLRMPHAPALGVLLTLVACLLVATVGVIAWLVWTRAALDAYTAGAPGCGGLSEVAA
jgi:hypothetical protein